MGLAGVGGTHPFSGIVRVGALSLWCRAHFIVASEDLTEFRSPTLKGVGLGGLAASDGVGWMNVLDGLPQSGHGSTSHAAMHLKDHALTPNHLACTVTHRKL